MEWDDNNDGKISWTEALDEFGKIFRSFMNDNRDHWVSTHFSPLPPSLLPSDISQIGLVDKNTEKYFWYNLKDNQSFWMSEEDENYFRSLVAQGSNRDEAIKPLKLPA